MMGKPNHHATRRRTSPSALLRTGSLLPDWVDLVNGPGAGLLWAWAVVLVLTTAGCGPAEAIPAPTCDDGAKNQNESDIDCGGPCEPCAIGKACGDAADCQSGICSGAVCLAYDCGDGLKNGKESDRDCGGTKCPGCAVGQVCGDGDDCLSGICEDNICGETTCDDEKKNGNETGVDCGGDECGKCANGKDCLGPADCLSDICTDNHCRPHDCYDGLRNGTETDVDCGGAACLANEQGRRRCAVDKACVEPEDCQSDICSDSVCVAEDCTDTLTNGTETDEDCGGSGGCDRCANGQMCLENGDCQAGSVCEDDTDRCLDGCQSGVKDFNETGEDCGGTAAAPGLDPCPRCAAGEGCGDPADCTTDSGFCVQDICTDHDCHDGIKNSDEDEVDCGGTYCAPCGANCAIARSLGSSVPVAVSGDTGVDALGDGFAVDSSHCPGLPHQAGSGANDEVFAFTAPTTQYYHVRLDPTGFDAVLYVVTDCADVGSSCVAGARFLSAGLPPVAMELTQGVEYFFIVDGFGTGEAGTYDLSIATCAIDCAGRQCGDNGCGGTCPPGCNVDQYCDDAGQCQAIETGDQCGDPFMVGTLPWVDSAADTSGFRDLYQLGANCGFPAGHGAGAKDAVYQFAPGDDNEYTVEITAANFDTVLYILDDCADLGSCLGANDAIGTGGESVSVNPGASNTVYILVDGKNSSQAGTFTLEVSNTCLPECPPANNQCGDDGCGAPCPCTDPLVCKGYGFCGVGGQCQDISECAEACSPATALCVPIECSTDGTGCAATETCVEQELESAVYACYASCTPFTDLCAGAKTCLLAPFGLGGYCKDPGLAAAGERCWPTSLTTGCAAGLDCVPADSDDGKAVCRHLCSIFEGIGPECPDGAAEPDDDQTCHPGGVCMENFPAVDPANIGNACANPGVPCGDDGADILGVCSPGSLCERLCRTAVPADCPAEGETCQDAYGWSDLGVCRL